MCKPTRRVIAVQKLKITYCGSMVTDEKEEIVEVSHRVERENEWLVFSDGSDLVLQLRSDDVERIERVA